MRIFYTGSDIEDLAARGVRQLEIGPMVALTDAARERAEELGIVLLTPGSPPASKVTAPAAPVKDEPAPSRPRGCQHGPLSTNTSPSKSAGGKAPMVDQLVAAVSTLKKQGG